MSERQESSRKVRVKKDRRNWRRENERTKKDRRLRGMKRGSEGRAKWNKRQDIKKEKEREKQESMRKKRKGKNTHTGET